MPEQGTKALRIQCRQPGKRGVDEFCTNRQLRILAYRRAAIPGAHILADVAAKDLTAHLCTQWLSNWPPLFNRKVGDTEARIHLVGRDQGAGGAGIEASRATTAAVFRHADR